MREIPYLTAINEALAEEMAKDETVFVIGEDVQAGTFMVTTGLVQKFGPDRVMDTPLSETAVAGACVGAAMAGYRPIADFMFADFMWCCADEVFLKAAKWRFIHGGKVNLPLVFLAAMGGGARTGPEHSQCPESVVLHNPGLKLALPSTPYDAKGLLKTAIRDNSPVVFFYHKQLLGARGEVPEEEYTIPLGVADVKREGKDVTVVATSLMAQLALNVASELEGRVSVEVIDPRTLEPLDIDTIVNSVKKTGRVVIVDEDTKRCGVGAEIGMQIMENVFDSLDAPIQRVAAANLPIAGGYMEQYVLPQPKDIVAAIEAVMA
ncbi:MAG: alpha-ketoacid dehydrogenase subunit beta [Dehalococcoidia bacterium]